MERRVAVMVLVVAGLALCATVFAKPGQVTVRVIDTDAKGKEKTVEGAIVKLYVKLEDIPGLPPGWELVAVGTTNEHGKVVLPTAAGKTYYPEVISPSGETTCGEVFTANSNGGAATQTVKI